MASREQEEEPQAPPPATPKRTKAKGGKGGKGAKGAKGKEPVSRSKRAGLLFPVGRIHSYLKKGMYTPRVSGDAAVYLAAVLEFLCAEVLFLSARAAKDNKYRRIAPRHIQLAVRNDAELDELLDEATLASGGVLPNIHSALLNKGAKTEEGKKTAVRKKKTSSKTKQKTNKKKKGNK